MAAELLQALCALAAFAVPLGFAWAALRFGAWRHRRPRAPTHARRQHR
ncbi:hypothetical protein ACA040_004848 [Xenophilus aerolatus]